jgi:hypothetical protein
MCILEQLHVLKLDTYHLCQLANVVDMYFHTAIRSYKIKPNPLSEP